ncbi:MAG: FGGY-family carbohydrate kinase [Rectinemataceae bacterium]
MRGIVTIDAGTTSMRAILFDESGRVLSLTQRDNPPTFYPDGRVEQPADTWKDSLVPILSGCAEAAREKGVEIIGLALTAQRSSVIPVDDRGRALHPAIMWQDQRTEAICRELEGHQRYVYGKTGLRISPVFSAVKMTWLRRNRNELFERTHKMLGVQDYLMYHMTGNFVTDRSLASRTNLFDLSSGEWDPGLVELFQVDSRHLCGLIDQGAEAGSLGASMARATGLAEGLPVVSAGGDQQCAALGMGLLAPGQLVANTGTGSYVIGLSERPVFDDRMRLSCNVAATVGNFIVEAGILSSGSLYAWFRDRFYDSPEAKSGFATVNEEAAASPPGAHGVLLLPHFKGAGSPHWNPNAKGLFFGLSLGTGRGDMARAVLEGIAAEMAQSVSLMENLTGGVREIRVSGGLSNNPLYNQIQADMYGRRVLRSSDGEATARGAWISAAVRLGLYGGHAAAFAAARTAASAPDAASRTVSDREYVPDPSTESLYAALRERAERLYAALDAAGVYATSG